MAAPNIVGVTTITGKTAVANVSTTAADVITNGAGSGKVIKVNVIIASNANTTTNANVSISLYRSSVSYGLINNVTVPFGAAMGVLDKAVYLEEGDTIRMTASANSIIQTVCSYEEIS